MNNNSDPHLDRQADTQVNLDAELAYNNAHPGLQSTHQLSQQAGSNATGSTLSDSKQRSLIGYNHITYLLYVLSYFTAGLLWIVPIVMNYAKRHDADNTWLATHFDWQIKTFWYSIVWFVIGGVIVLSAFGVLGVGMLAESNSMAFGSLFMAGLGLFIIAVAFIWHLYRIIRGWIALTDNRPVP